MILGPCRCCEVVGADQHTIIDMRHFIVVARCPSTTLPIGMVNRVYSGHLSKITIDDCPYVLS
jgi:hypothetical protein